MKYEEIQKKIQEKLSPKRYKHSQGVVETATTLAKQYEQDIEMIKKIAIAHDIAKEMTSEELYDYADKNGIELDEIEKQEPEIVHSKIGADICKKEFNFTQEMQKAILYHTTGNVSMNIVDKIIFIADKIEPGRTYLNTEEMMEIASRSLEEAILCICQYTIQYSLKKETLIHPDTIYLMNTIISHRKKRKEE